MAKNTKERRLPRRVSDTNRFREIADITTQRQAAVLTDLQKGKINREQAVKKLAATIIKVDRMMASPMIGSAKLDKFKPVAFHVKDPDLRRRLTEISNPLISDFTDTFYRKINYHLEDEHKMSRESLNSLFRDAQKLVANIYQKVRSARYTEYLTKDRTTGG